MVGAFDAFGKKINLENLINWTDLEVMNTFYGSKYKVTEIFIGQEVRGLNLWRTEEQAQISLSFVQVWKRIKS